VKDEERLRTFVALEIAEEMRARIATLQDELRKRAPEVRWTRPEGIHLTLRFLGSTTLGQVERLQPMLAEAAGHCAPAEVGIAGLGTFPPRGAPRVLWLGLSVPEPFLTLQAACERAAVAVGFPREERPFRAHLTLGRWRDRARRPELHSPDLGSSRVDTLVLFRSEPRSGGSVYTPLSRFPLGTK
jgi:RNA 2',3'-cyclic 3'-phosphodiesterase